jgi:hypothetical protein
MKACSYALALEAYGHHSGAKVKASPFVCVQFCVHGPHLVAVISHDDRRASTISRDS